MTRSAERTDFLSDLLVTAVEGGINYWAEIDARDDLDSATGALNGQPLRWARIVDREEGAVYTVDLDTVAAGLDSATAAIAARTVRDDADLRTADRTDGREGDFDAGSADLVVQFGLFDAVVYG